MSVGGRSMTQTAQSGWGALQRQRFITPVLALGAVILAVAGLLATDWTVRASALAEAKLAAANEAALLAAGLESELEKFSLVPLVLARDPQVQSLMKSNRAVVRDVNQRLEQLARQTGASEIYLMDIDGLTLAASNWQRPDSFIGTNYGFRRYFRNAKRSGLSSQFALGTVSRRPGLFIARRVDAPTGPVGVVAVKVEFPALEAKWAKATSGVFVTDPEGVILVTSHPSWRFGVVPSNAPARRNAPDDLRDFGRSELALFDPDALRTHRLGLPYIVSHRPIAQFDWTLHLFSNPEPAVVAAKAGGRLIFLLLLVLIGIVAGLAAIALRRRRAKEEILINQRTALLRDQLQQANRLATLGQITAGVGHEIRQPVAAIRILAETGERLADRGAHDEARHNFTRITALTDRIGAITDELLRFSRRGLREARQVPLRQVIDGALLLLRDRMAQLGTELALPPGDELSSSVRGEHVGLEQVLINLLQNALDATGQGGKVTISVARGASSLGLSVTDDGPGLTADQRASLFQPFATTKVDGLGLGLVISQDIMRSLGGELLEEPMPHGCRFTMMIPCS